MMYIFYIVSFLIAVFFISEVINTLRGRAWGENP